MNVAADLIESTSCTGATVFCIECGRPNPEHGKYCHNCGTPLFRATIEPTSPTKIESSSVQWPNALALYRYPADLTKFVDRAHYSGWFTRNIEVGDRAQTIQFEDSFRQNAPHNLEAWFEVVFWKLYSSHPHVAKLIIDRIKRDGISANDLWAACCNFINDPSASRFKTFQKLLVSSPNIAVCATFPAFIAPDQFPMADSQIAKWVLANHEEHSQPHVGTIALQPPQPFDPKKGQLKMSHYPFFECWTLWCRGAAKQLNQGTQDQWRPRDVEMAVFTAQRERLTLPPIFAAL